METKIGLHLKVTLRSLEQLQTDMELLTRKNGHWIWLTDDREFNDLDFVQSIINQNGVKVITDSIRLLEKDIVDAFITNNYENIPALKKKYPNIKIGGLATDIAGCKNTEYFGGSFVYLGPIDQIGTDHYTTLIPKEPDYEWRFLDIIIPVFGYGTINSNQLTELTHQVNLAGFAAHNHDFKLLSKHTFRFDLD